MKAQKGKFEVRGVEFEVEYCYSPFRPGCYYMNNGDPGYPDEPADVEIFSVSHKGTDFTEFFTDYLFELLEDEILKSREAE